MKICIIGQGNVGTHLAKALSPGADTTAVSSRTPGTVPADADLYLIAVSDSAIAEVSDALAGVSGIVAHTSGSTPIEVLSAHPRRGVFYPLQTFSRDIPLDYSRIPVFIEADSPATATMLKKAAGIFTTHVHDADSRLREKLHLAAVFGCNFTTRMMAIADDILAAEGLSFELLKPLLIQTLEKAVSLSHPALGQTGPAARGDMCIIEKHLKALSADPRLASIYSIVSHDILEAT